jgi:hypothetical protein
MTDERPGRGIAALRGAVAAGVTTVLGIELLSRVDGIRQLPLLALLLTAAAVFGAFVRRAPRPAGTGLPESRSERLAWGTVLAIGLVTLAIALRAAPNTWDSMSYHLARVAEWMAHGTIDSYVTGTDRQLWQPPFGEYFLLLGYGALDRRDYLANLPQWLAGAGTVVAVVEIARLLGAGSPGRSRIALWLATTPVVILEATSTQNDLLAALWIAIAATFALREVVAPSPGWQSAIWFGAAIGLAIGTKGTAIPLAIPLVVLFAAAKVPVLRLPAIAGQMALALIVMVGLNIGPALRNLAVFDSPFGPASVRTALRPAQGFLPIVSNAITNASLAVGTPWDWWNRGLETAIASAHRSAGLDLASLYPYFGGFRIVPWSTHEDLAGNPIHWLVGCVGLALLASGWRGLTKAERAAGLSLIAMLLVFAATVRWQPYNNRLATPIFVLVSPILIRLVDRRFPRASALALVGAVLLAVPPLFVNASRPLVSPGAIGWSALSARSVFLTDRGHQYFVNQPGKEAPYQAVMTTLDRIGCRRVALKTGYDSWEYPLWALGRSRNLGFEPYQADRTMISDSGPCATIALDQPPDWRPPSRPDSGAQPLLVAPGLTLWR